MTSQSQLPKVALSIPVPDPATGSNGSFSPPYTRESSPSPSISPTPALYPCPSLTRSFSSSEYSSSAASTISQPSVNTRSSSASAALRQRGYVRPQGVSFAPSAGNRDSVLSLGSIAHLQYYFARTGLLDGKGAQLAKDDRGKPGMGKSSQNATPGIYVPLDGVTGTETAQEDLENAEEPAMLPPTVSTYSNRTQYLPPPPDLDTLRHELNSALENAKQALQQIQGHEDKGKIKSEEGGTSQESTANGDDNAQETLTQSPGWYEIQGIHVLDVVTLAIRAAKIYYTSHEDPYRLYSIKSERKMREELLGIMDVLKKTASRNFAGGMRRDELTTITGWLDGVENVLTQEQALERQEADERASWIWLEGLWQGQERKRERLFLNSFKNGEPLPEWDEQDTENQALIPFHEALKTGLTLVQLHNALLKKSKRQFGEIKTYHTDLAKPYRCAENLRYWIKAAEIRWETKLKVNVSGVVNGKKEAYPDFDAAILQWSQAVREELTKEWRDARAKPKSSTMLCDYVESNLDKIDA